MESLEELLPGIEQFLCIDLAEEKLSPNAERKRQGFVERIEILKLQRPPNLPPRPDNLSKSPLHPPQASSSPRPLNGATDDQIAHLREYSRCNASNDSLNHDQEEFGLLYEEFDGPENPIPQTKASITHTAATESGVIEEIDDSGEALYEVPVEQRVVSPAAKSQAAKTDVTENSYMSDGSCTSYESYEEEESEPVYNNQLSTTTDIPQLPRVRSKKTKRKASKENIAAESCIKDLTNVSLSGELYQKGLISWTKRYCAISDNRFMCYKGERDNKLLLNFPLIGYSVLYIESLGFRSHVIRLSHAGCETHYFSADCKDKADLWVQHLNAAAKVAELAMGNYDVRNSECNISQSSDTSNTPITQAEEKMSEGVCSTSFASSSEGGSGDGTIGGKQNTSYSSFSEKDKDKSDKDKRKTSKTAVDSPSFGESLAQWFGTIGKKKKVPTATLR